MENILNGLDELKANGIGLSIHDLIQILQKVDSSDTLESIELFPTSWNLFTLLSALNRWVVNQFYAYLYWIYM